MINVKADINAIQLKILAFKSTFPYSMSKEGSCCTSSADLCTYCQYDLIYICNPLSLNSILEWDTDGL